MSNPKRGSDAWQHAAVRRETNYRRELLAVSKAYYIDGKSKVSIAEAMGLSRFQVARRLVEAQKLGIVSITVASGATLRELSETLAIHLSLGEARVVEVYGDERNVRAAVGREAGTLLSERLDEGEVLGLGWGRTLTRMFDGITRLPHIEIVVLSGQFSGDTDNAAAALTRRTVALTGGEARVMPAPFFIDDARIARALRRDPRVAAVVADFERLTTAIVGVGAVIPETVSMAYEGVPPRFVEAVLNSGAVGEVQGLLFDEDGNSVNARLGPHTLNISPQQLLQVPRVIAAVSDARKAPALRAVCCAGVLTEVVVDVELALAVLALPPVTPLATR